MRNSSDSTSSVVRDLFEILRHESPKQSIVIPMLLLLFRNIDETDLGFILGSDSGDALENLSTFARKSAQIYALDTAETRDLSFPVESLLSELTLVSPDVLPLLLKEASREITRSKEAYDKICIYALELYIERLGPHANFQIPEEICQFMLDCLGGSESKEHAEEKNLFIPYLDNSIRLLRLSKGLHTIGQNYNRQSHDLAQLMAHCIVSGNIQGIDNGLGNPYLLNDFNPFARSHRKVVDYIIATPPFGVRIPPHTETARTKDLDTEWVLYIQEQLADQGSAVITVTNRFLSATGSHYDDIRKFLIRHSMLEKVITMPSHLLNTTAIPFTILVLKKGREHGAPVTMIDASDAFVPGGHNSNALDASQIKLDGSGPAETHAIVSQEEIEENNCDLRPGLYLPPFRNSEEEGNRSLVSIETILPLSKVRPKKGHEKGLVIPNQVLSSDRGYDAISADTLKEWGGQPKAERPYKTLPFECILVSQIVHKGRLSTVWVNHSDTALLVGPDILIFEFDRLKVNPEWLLHSLRSERTQQEVAALVTGFSIPRISRQDFARLRIPQPPSLEEQKAIVAAARSEAQTAKIREQGLENLIAQNEVRFWDEVRTKKHSMGPLINDLIAGLEVLQNALAQHDSLRADTLISKRRGTNYADYLGSLITTSQSLGRLTEKLDDRTFLHKNTACDPLELLMAWHGKQTHRSCKIEIFDTVSEDLLAESDEESDDSLLDLNLNLDNFHELLDLLLDNALRHGFIDPEKIHIFRITVCLDPDQGNLIISVSNNGKPMPEGMDTRRFITRDAHAGETGNTGIGGAQVHAIMQHFGGSVTLENDDSSLFPVTFTLTFPTL